MIAEAGEDLPVLDELAFERLLDPLANRRVVLVDVASHGTAEF